jgi:AsmA protein
LKDGALAANLVDATAYGGRLDGELTLTRRDSGIRIAMRLKLADADIGGAASDFGWPILTGKGTAEFSIVTAGGCAAELVAGLQGAASLDLTDGAVEGVNLEEALRRSQRRPLDVAKDMRSGGTAFERVTLSAAIGGGVAHVDKGELVARGVKADLAGAVDLAGRSLNLRLETAQTGSTGSAPADGARLVLEIAGPWASPSVQTVGETDAAEPGAAPPERSP